MSKYLFARPLTFGYGDAHSLAMNSTQLQTLTEHTDYWSSLAFTGSFLSYAFGFGGLLRNGITQNSINYGYGNCGDLRSADYLKKDVLLMFDSAVNACKLENKNIVWLNHTVGDSESVSSADDSWGQLLERTRNKYKVTSYDFDELGSKGLSETNTQFFLSSYGLMVLTLNKNTKISENAVSALEAAYAAGVPFIVLATKCPTPLNQILNPVGITAYSKGYYTHTSSAALTRYIEAFGNNRLFTGTSEICSTVVALGTAYTTGYDPDNVFFKITDTEANSGTRDGEEGTWYYCLSGNVFDDSVYDATLTTPTFNRLDCCFEEEDNFATTVGVPLVVIKPTTWKAELDKGIHKITWSGGDLNGDAPASVPFSIEVHDNAADTVVNYAGIEYRWTRSHPGVVYNGANGCGHIHYLQIDKNNAIKDNVYYGTPQTLNDILDTCPSTDIFVVLAFNTATNANLGETFARIGGTRYFYTHKDTTPFLIIGSKSWGKDLSYQWCKYTQAGIGTEFLVSGEFRGGYFIPDDHAAGIGLSSTTNKGAVAIVKIVKKLTRQDNGRVYPFRVCSTFQDLRFKKLLQYSITTDCGLLNVEMPCVDQWDYPNIWVNDVDITESDGAPVCTSQQFHKITSCFLEQTGQDLRITPNPDAPDGDLGFVAYNYGCWFAWPDGIRNWLTGNGKTGNVNYRFQVYASGWYSIVCAADDWIQLNIDNGYFVGSYVGWRSHATWRVYLSAGMHNVRCRAANDSDAGESWSKNNAVFGFAIHSSFQGTWGGYYNGRNLAFTSRDFVSNTGLHVEVDEAYKRTTTSVSVEASDAYKGSEYANSMCYFGAFLQYNKTTTGVDSSKFVLRSNMQIDSAGWYSVQVAADGIGGVRIDGSPWRDSESNMKFAYNETITYLAAGNHILEFWLQRIPVWVNAGYQKIPFGIIVYPYAVGSSMYDVYANFTVSLSGPVSNRDPIYVDYTTADFPTGSDPAPATSTAAFVDQSSGDVNLPDFLFKTQDKSGLLGWDISGSTTYNNSGENSSVFLVNAASTTSTNIDSTSPIWVSGSAAGVAGGTGRVTAYYKFYTFGGNYRFNYGGSNALAIKVMRSDSAGNALYPTDPDWEYPKWTPATFDENGDLVTDDIQNISNTAPMYVQGEAVALSKSYYRVEIAATDYVDLPDAVEYPKLLRLIAAGNSSPLAQSIAGSAIQFLGINYPVSRSYNFIVFDSEMSLILERKSFDVAGSLQAAVEASSWLNSQDPSSIIALVTYDEPEGNLMASPLYSALLSIGADPAMLAAMHYRSAYILVGKNGLGPARGINRFAGYVDADTGSYLELYLNGADLSYNDLGLPKPLTPTADAWMGLDIEYTESSKLSDPSNSPDYISSSGVLQFNKGDQNKYVSVLVIGDELVEPDEQFKVLLTDCSRGQITDNTGIATILDDDDPTIFSTWQFEKLMSWNYDGFWPAGQANISVFLGKLERYSYPHAIWTTNSAGTFDGDRMTVWAYYKFYTRGGAFKTIYGGDDDAWVQVHHADANGNVVDATPVLNHYHHKHGRTFTGDLTLSAGWYRVFVQAYNKDENSFNSNPGWVGLRILRYL